jgi:hypothetical protein
VFVGADPAVEGVARAEVGCFRVRYHVLVGEPGGGSEEEVETRLEKGI